MLCKDGYFECQEWLGGNRCKAKIERREPVECYEILGNEQKCRICGCSWHNACPGGCYWVEVDLCSKCAETEKTIVDMTCKKIIHQCQFCGTSDTECLEYDKFGHGFWCEVCDGYSYINPEQAVKHKFTLVLENKSTPPKEETLYSPKKNKQLPKKSFLNKRLSPLRYPGGKSKLAEYIL